MSISDQKVNPQSLVELLRTDKQLRESQEMASLIVKWNRIANDEAIAKASKALTAKHHKVHIASNTSEALKIALSLIPQGASVGNGSSQTLEDIGFVAWGSTPDGPSKNKNRVFKAEIGAAYAKGDQKTAGDLSRQNLAADVFFAGLAAVTQEGDLVWGSATGTRVSAFAPKTVVFVVGTNKIVPTLEDAVKRLEEFQVPLESARARLAYGVPSSTLAETGIIRSGSAYAPEKHHVIIVKDQLGF